MRYWLKRNICCEPLILNWFAWIHLISPITLSLNLRKRYLKNLRSYLKQPELHLEAAQDQKLRGASYVNLSLSMLQEAHNLVNKIQNAEILIKLSEALDDLQDTLLKAEGCSLEEFYHLIPESLSGCVELVYGMQNHAMIRLVESLIYKLYYNTSFQSLMLSPLKLDARSFVMSTPRFPAADQITLNFPFRSPKIDALFRLKRKGESLEMINNIFETQLSADQIGVFFDSEQPKTFQRITESNVIRVRYLGHACILIETDKTSILIDPLISYSLNNNDQRFTYDDLPEVIDYALITHAHQDHCDIETLLQIRHFTKQIIVPDNNNGFIADPSLKLALSQIGFEKITALKELDEVDFTDGKIIAIPFFGEHGDLNIQSKLAYFLKVQNKTFLFAVDSNNMDSNLYRRLANIVGKIDILFIGMESMGAPCSWTYGPLFQTPIKREYDQKRRLNGSNSEKALKLVEIFNCDEAYIYAMGQEPWLMHLMGMEYTENSPQLIEANKFIAQCKSMGIQAEKPYLKREWIYTGQD